MKKTIFPLSLLMIFTLFSCAQEAEMKIDDFLKNHSKAFEISNVGSDWESNVKMGYFTSYPQDVATGWLQASDFGKFFSLQDPITFVTDNQDNYIYEHILEEVSEAKVLNSFAEHFNLPLSIEEDFADAYIGYLYAPHDEYSIVCVRKQDGYLEGYLSNGFDVYEIHPVIENKESEALMGYQIKLYDEYVGSVQLKNKQIFRMTTEYCDATEVILASIAAMLVKCESIKS